MYKIITRRRRIIFYYFGFFRIVVVKVIKNMLFLRYLLIDKNKNKLRLETILRGFAAIERSVSYIDKIYMLQYIKHIFVLVSN